MHACSIHRSVVLRRCPTIAASCRPAVEQFTDRVYGIPSAEFFPVHEQLLATLRDLLSPDKLEVMAQQLLQYAEEHLQDWRQQGRVSTAVSQTF